MDAITKTFCKNFRRLFDSEQEKDPSLTQGKFGKQLGISQKTVSNILQAVELGRHIRSDTIDAVAEGLGIETWKLLIPEIPLDLLKNRQLDLVVDGYIAADGDGRNHMTRIAEREAIYSTKPQQTDNPAGNAKKAG